MPEQKTRPRPTARRRSAVALAAGVACLLPVAPATLAGAAAPETSNAALEWNGNAVRAATAACIAPFDNPLHESRMYAMVHIAVHDALNAVDRRSAPYAFDGTAEPGASAPAAVAAAARGALVPALRQLPAPIPQECIDAGVASAEASYTAALARIPAGAAREDGIAVGRAAARAVVDLRAGDGSRALLVDPDFPQGTAPGQWRFTPDRPFAFGPSWGEVTPFALDRASQLRPAAPYTVGSAAYAADLAEVKALGGDGTTTPTDRTADQTQIALFWTQSSPEMWNRIARGLARSRGLDLWESARLLALLDIALADGYIGSFETKFHYRFWRPVTAAREAGDDGNPATSPDPSWTPLVTTPPIPDWDSAHSVEGGAAAAVFRRFFRTDRIAFSACSRTLPDGQNCDDASPVRREFRSFSQAAGENAVSRIYIGFHFRHAVETGTQHGRKIGDLVVRELLQPVTR